jgi:hypothetical protein
MNGVGGQRNAPAALPPGQRHGTDCTGGWEGPQTGMEVCGKTGPPAAFDPGTAQPVASRHTDYAIPAHLQPKARIFQPRFNRILTIQNKRQWCGIGQHLFRTGVLLIPAYAAFAHAILNAIAQCANPVCSYL